MGKKNGDSSSSSSWLSLVKRAFRSPIKDINNNNNNNVNDKRNGRRRDDSGLDHEEEEKKREKRRWLFRKPSRLSHPTPAASMANELTVEIIHPQMNPVMASTEQRHAIAVAAATAAAAEAAMATAQAAMEIARLTRSSPQPTSSGFPKQQHCAALAIQTAFRGYLARRALRALKGLVRLQALVRGHNVRKQAKLTLRCMQALVRVQDRMRDQRARLSHDGVSRKSMFSESNNLWESSYLQDIRERRSTSRNTSCCTADFWDEKEQQQTTKMMDEIKAVLQVREREKTLTNAFSQQIWTRRQPSAGDDEKEIMEQRTEWLDRWMTAKQWETTESRASMDKRDPIKTVEVDTSRPYSSYGSAPPKTYGRRSLHHYRQPPSPSPNQFSPLHRPNPPLVYSPVTPSPSKTRPIQVRSASPRSHRGDDRIYSAANTPCLSSAPFYTNQRNHANTVGPTTSTMIPNYMAATESARARARSQSAPRQRPSTPERDKGLSGAKKRLSYPEQQQGHMVYINHHHNNNNHANLRSPSFKSGYGGGYAAEQRSNMSCYTESMVGGGEISPCSTTDLRWFR